MKKQKGKFQKIKSESNRRYYLNKKKIKAHMIRGVFSMFRGPFMAIPKMHFSKKLSIGEASAVLEQKIKSISQLVSL
jgi:hypothetical protein